MSLPRIEGGEGESQQRPKDNLPEMSIQCFLGALSLYVMDTFARPKSCLTESKAMVPLMTDVSYPTAGFGSTFSDLVEIARRLFPGHGRNDCNQMDPPVPHVLGIVGPFGVEMEPHGASLPKHLARILQNGSKIKHSSQMLH